MSFLRHGEIYRSDGNGRDGRAAAPLDRCDEFPNGYSSSGCSPAEPASASPSSFSFSGPVLRDNQFAANGNLSLFSLSQTGGPLHTVPRAVPRAPALPPRSPSFSRYASSRLTALRQPEEHKEFLKNVSEDWIHGLSRLHEQSGCASDTAGTMPTVLLAGFRGFMLEYCARRDRARIQKALACWADALEGRNQ